MDILKNASSTQKRQDIFDFAVALGKKIKLTQYEEILELKKRVEQLEKEVDNLRGRK